MGGTRTGTKLRRHARSPCCPRILISAISMDGVYLSFVLKWRADIFRRSYSLHRPILAHVREPTIRGTPDWRYPEQLRLPGSSCYPAWMEFGEGDAARPAPGKRVPKATGLHHKLWKSVLMRYDCIRGPAAAARSGWRNYKAARSPLARAWAESPAF
jgi:hypothetical protein